MASDFPPPPPSPSPPPLWSTPLDSRLCPPSSGLMLHLSTPFPAAVAAALSPITFYTVSEKLDSKNFLLWKQQIEPVLHGHRLNHFVVSPMIPPVSFWGWLRFWKCKSGIHCLGAARSTFAILAANVSFWTNTHACNRLHLFMETVGVKQRGNYSFLAFHSLCVLLIHSWFSICFTSWWLLSKGSLRFFMHFSILVQGSVD